MARETRPPVIPPSDASFEAYADFARSSEASSYTPPLLETSEAPSDLPFATTPCLSQWGRFQVRQDLLAGPGILNPYCIVQTLRLDRVLAFVGRYWIVAPPPEEEPPDPGVEEEETLRVQVTVRPGNGGLRIR